MNESELRMRVGIFINGKWKVVLKPLVVVTTSLVHPLTRISKFRKAQLEILPSPTRGEGWGEINSAFLRA